MTWTLFVLDMVKQSALAAVIGVPLLLLVLWLMQRMGANWWLYVWVVWMGFNLLLLVIYPSVIAPLFNKFTPLDDESLRARIERLLARCGFKSHGLFVMDSSRRSSHGNAYFTGFGAAKRIVLFDTLIRSLEPAEVEAVLAHELGHFKHHHVIKRIALLFVMSLGFLWLLGFMMNEAWFYSALAVSDHGTAMALILFFLVMPVFTFALQPLSSLYSRKHEFEADAYAARQASAADLVHALTKLYTDNAATLTPDPLHSAFYDSHPPAAMRIARLQAMSPT
jgi:STE24 endopeptidase